jgi:thioester reductase-like protein
VYARTTESGVLLTGATGFLGGEILLRLLERTDADGGPTVYLPVRAHSDEGARARVRDLLSSLLGHADPYSERVVAVAVDITQPGLGTSPERRRQLAERVGRIIHCAASVSFTLDLAAARSINVEGTRRMLELAELADERGGLDSFAYVSTAYVGGDHQGSFAESDLDVAQGFRNAYERSKFEAERLVRGRAERVRARIFRPSIVVGDSTTGWTPSFNVIYSPLRAFSQGALRLLPARRSSPVDVVPVDFVADAVLALAADGEPGTTYHLTAGPRASSVGEIVELASARLEQPRPQLLSPALYRRTLHPLLLRLGSERRRRALRASEVFFPYFAMALHYDNERTRQALEPHGIEVPALPDYFDRLLDFAVEADWGKRPIPRHRRHVAPLSPRPRRRRRLARYPHPTGRGRPLNRRSAGGRPASGRS